MLDSLCIQRHDVGAEQKDILKNIYWLLNTRQGSLRHMPDFGLVDFAAYSGHEAGKQEYIGKIKELICKFEPRISQLVVQECEYERADSLLKLTFLAKTNQATPLHFSSILLMNGEMLVPLSFPSEQHGHYDFDDRKMG